MKYCSTCGPQINDECLIIDPGDDFIKIKEIQEILFVAILV